MKPSGYLQRVRRDVDRQLAESRHICIQMCLHAALIAANEVLQLGPGRAKAFCDAFSATLSEIAAMTVADGRTDRELWHTKDMIDRRIRQICGENFQPWEERYR